MNKYYSANRVRSVVAIATSKAGDLEAEKRGYKRITLAQMNEGERSAIRSYRLNKSAEFVILLG